VKDAVIFGVGSALIVEIEETLRRLDCRIVCGVRNVEGPVRASAGYPIVDAANIAELPLSRPIVTPLFQPRNRRTAIAHAQALGFQNHLTLVDPTAIVPQRLEASKGLYVNAGAIIGAHVRFGEHVTINRGASVGHHSQLGDFVSLGPRATLCGEIIVESGVLIGAGAVIVPRIHIGENAVIGAGAVVVHNVKANTMVVGNPARPVET